VAFCSSSSWSSVTLCCSATGVALATMRNSGLGATWAPSIVRAWRFSATA
jgi:hypothetical protein